MDENKNRNNFNMHSEYSKYQSGVTITLRITEYFHSFLDTRKMEENNNTQRLFKWKKNSICTSVEKRINPNLNGTPRCGSIISPFFPARLSHFSLNSIW